MNNINSLILKVLQKNNNVITISQVLKLGFSRMVIAKYVRLGLLVRVRQGVYMLEGSIHDDMYTLILRSKNIVFSHESALFLNGISERTPFVHTITIPSNKSISKAIQNVCKCFYIKPSLYKVGLIEKKTTFGNKVKCYDLERTICDFLRTRNRIDEETVISAIKNYISYKKKDLNKLHSYAKLFKVDGEIKKYLEVLL